MISIVKGKTEVSRSIQEACLGAGSFPSASLLAWREWPPTGAALKHCFSWWV